MQKCWYNELNENFNKTAKRLLLIWPHTKQDLKRFINFNDKDDAF